MKPFDLNLAKEGHPVITRDGHQVRIICFDRDDGYCINIEKDGSVSHLHTYSVISLIRQYNDDSEEKVYYHDPDTGMIKFDYSGRNPFDLFMKEV